MRIIYNNVLRDATITCTTENLNFSKSGLYSTTLLQKFRTTSGDDQRIVFEADDFRDVNAIALLGHNLIDHALVTLQANYTNEWTDPVWEKSLTITDDNIIETFTMEDSTEDPDPNFMSVFIDNAHLDYIQLSELFLGTAFTMPGMAPDQTIAYNTIAEKSVTNANVSFGYRGRRYRNPTINFPMCTNEQRHNINALFDIHENWLPFILQLYENDLSYESFMWCIIDQDGITWKKNKDNTLRPWATSIKFREVR